MTDGAGGGAGGGRKGPPAAPLGAVGRVLSVAVGVMIATMMVVTAIDVIGRYFLGRPLPGAFEVTEILMGLTIFAGMPLASAAREHITVNLIESWLTPRALAVQAACTDWVCAAVAAAMAWRVGARGLGLIEAREVTLVLGAPRGWIALAMAAFLVVASAVFVWSGIFAWRAAKTR